MRNVLLTGVALGWLSTLLAVSATANLAALFERRPEPKPVPDAPN